MTSRSPRSAQQQVFLDVFRAAAILAAIMLALAAVASAVTFWALRTFGG